MLLHRYQTEAYKENGPMGSPFKGQGRILAILKLKPEISHRELSYLLGISTQSMSELLRKLENKGYVKRVPSEHDRRSMDIILTEEGRRAVEQADGFDGRDTDRLFDCFDDQEQKQFKGFLERLEDEIIRHLDPEHPSDYTFGRMKEMHDYIISRYIGSHTVKADPSSGRLSTSIRPWHSEMILLTRARPRPFPSMFRLCSPW